MFHLSFKDGDCFDILAAFDPRSNSKIVAVMGLRSDHQDVMRSSVPEAKRSTKDSIASASLVCSIVAVATPVSIAST